MTSQQTHLRRLSCLKDSWVTCRHRGDSQRPAAPPARSSPGGRPHQEAQAGLLELLYLARTGCTHVLLYESGVLC